jgi:AraC-like DNA-binding protein
MEFSGLRVKDIHSVFVYSSNVKNLIVKNRKDHIIGIKLGGRGLHTFENQSFVMSKGDIYFLNQKDDYSVRVLEQGDAFSIHFTTYENIDTDSFCFEVQNTRMIISLLQKAETAYKSGNEHVVLSIIYELCDIFEKLRIKAYSKNDERIAAAKEYVDQNFTEPDCLENAVLQSKIGKRRFRDLFKQTYGQTPSRYITTKKIELAQGLLSVGGITITEISDKCGFSDVYYFSKVFKQFTGKSPSNWK